MDAGVFSSSCGGGGGGGDSEGSRDSIIVWYCLMSRFVRWLAIEVWWLWFVVKDGR